MPLRLPLVVRRVSTRVGAVVSAAVGEVVVVLLTAGVAVPMSPSFTKETR